MDSKSKVKLTLFVVLTLPNHCSVIRLHPVQPNTFEAFAVVTLRERHFTHSVFFSVLKLKSISPTFYKQLLG